MTYTRKVFNLSAKSIEQNVVVPAFWSAKVELEAPTLLAVYSPSPVGWATEGSKITDIKGSTPVISLVHNGKGSMIIDRREGPLSSRRASMHKPPRFGGKRGGGRGRRSRDMVEYPSDRERRTSIGRRSLSVPLWGGRRGFRPDRRSTVLGTVAYDLPDRRISSWTYATSPDPRIRRLERRGWGTTSVLARLCADDVLFGYKPGANKEAIQHGKA